MSIRTERVARMLQREVADLLQGEFHETSQSMLTVTETRVTKDLGIAYINVSVLGDTPEQRQAAFKRLDAITPQVRQALAQRIRHQVRRIPELRFFLDETQQYAAHMNELFAQIKAERDERGDDEVEGETPGVREDD
ncbi:MAG: 30S ribosome-binding factor RbfA [Rhodothermaceae bacterium]|nr:30S ribosome-binding factor RbfA [Rhodothermaceae bacterium]